MSPILQTWCSNQATSGPCHLCGESRVEGRVVASSGRQNLILCDACARGLVRELPRWAFGAPSLSQQAFGCTVQVPNHRWWELNKDKAFLYSMAKFEGRYVRLLGLARPEYFRVGCGDGFVREIHWSQFTDFCL